MGGVTYDCGGFEGTRKTHHKICGVPLKMVPKTNKVPENILRI